MCIQGVGLHPGGSASRREVCIQGCLHPRGSASRGICIQGGILHPGGWADPLPHQILRDMVNERAVRILPECILVFSSIVRDASDIHIFSSSCGNSSLPAANDLNTRTSGGSRILLGGADFQSGCANLFFAEKCIEMKDFGPQEGGCVSLAPPLRSPNDNHYKSAHYDVISKQIFSNHSIPKIGLLIIKVPRELVANFSQLGTSNNH